jgi:pSer/pThr/pTyr-binding forkhead associated (FHA) protein
MAEMARCALCSFVATRGYLCDAHAKAITAHSITSEQIVTTTTAGPATLLDAWGTALPVEEKLAIGRDPTACKLALLHPSISSHHATLAREGERWMVSDAGSRNGTFVDDERVTSEVVATGARLRFGEVTLYFIDQSLAPQARPEGPGRTAPTRRDQLVFSARLRTPGGTRIELSQRIEGGIVRANEALIDLGKLEFRLLQVLTEARRSSVDPELAFVSWSQIAERLEFRSYEADSENVRELVRRVRRKLQNAGVDDLIESKHGVGYRVCGALADA